MTIPTNAQDVDNFIVFGSINTFRYTNYRGETAMRKVIPLCLRFNTTGPYHKDQWVIEAWDLEKKDYRTFHLLGVNPR